MWLSLPPVTYKKDLQKFLQINPTMLKLRQLQKKKQEEQKSGNTANKVSAAQIRLQKDVTELDLPSNVQVSFPDPSNFFLFQLRITPQQGHYVGGSFKFSVEVNQNYPIEAPKIKCLQVVYHPNIDLQGSVCLNILREDWSPVLSLNSVLIGLNFLFLEPNPNDPLNKEAANVLVKDKLQFEANVANSMRGRNVQGVVYDDVRV